MKEFIIWILVSFLIANVRLSDANVLNLSGDDNLPIFNMREHQFVTLLEAYRSSNSKTALLCSEVLMEYASDAALLLSASSVSGTVDVSVFPNLLLRPDGQTVRERARAYKFDKVQVLVGSGYQLADDFFDALSGSTAHAAALNSEEYDEYGIGYSPLDYVWVLIYGKLLNATDRIACPAYPAEQSFFEELADDKELDQLAIGKPGDVLGTGFSGGYVFKFDSCYTELPVPCTTAAPGVDHCCPMWLIDGSTPGGGANWVSVSFDGTAYVCSPSSFENPPRTAKRSVTNLREWVAIEARLRLISVGYAGVVWGLTNSDRVYRLRPDGKWDLIPGRFTHISVGFDGTVLAVDRFDKIWRRSNEQWVQIAGRLEEVSVGDKYNIWGVDDARKVYVLEYGTDKWIEMPSAIQMDHVAVAASGFDVWTLKDKRAYRVARPDLLAAELGLVTFRRKRDFTYMTVDPAENGVVLNETEVFFTEDESSEQISYTHVGDPLPDTPLRTWTPQLGSVLTATENDVTGVLPGTTTTGAAATTNADGATSAPVAAAHTVTPLSTLAVLALALLVCALTATDA